MSLQLKMMKLFNFRISEERLNQIKENAKKEGRSTSSYLQNRALMETPNLYLGNWWDSPDKLRKIIKEVKKQHAKKCKVCD